MHKKSKIEAQYYDKRSKIVVSGLKQWFYNRLKTGVPAVVGRELSQELLEKSGRRRRICDTLFELLNAVINGKPAAMALMQLDVQTRANGDELRRSAGYKGLIVENDKLDLLEFFVQAFIFLTPVPPKLKTFIRGYPDDIQLKAIDMSKVDGLELLQENTPEAAVFAALSLVVPRNLLIAGIVQILNALASDEEWAYWTETVFAFALLRKDYLDFHMELTQEIERTAVHPDRQAELRFIFRPFYEKGVIDGRKEGRKEEKIQVAKKMREKGAQTDFIAEITGLGVDEILKL